MPSVLSTVVRQKTVDVPVHVAVRSVESKSKKDIYDVEITLRDAAGTENRFLIPKEALTDEILQAIEKVLPANQFRSFVPDSLASGSEGFEFTHGPNVLELHSFVDLGSPGSDLRVGYTGETILRCATDQDGSPRFPEELAPFIVP